MAKLLIVSKDEIVGKSLAQVAPIFGFPEVKMCDHAGAMREFLTWEPTHVVVLDYYERSPLREREQGFETWRDLKASAGDQRMIRCSFEDFDHPDFVRLPFKVAELFAKLRGEE